MAQTLPELWNRPRISFLFAAFVLLSLFLLGGCGGGRVAPDIGKGGGAHYKVGTPYQINGSWYYPREDFTYDETGIASWYGAEFHDKKTANGEIYNKNELTAAHKTLPMPSLARVTNLENGHAIVVRINDRGPYSSGRIIDLSQRSAQLLGFEQKGTASVRVQVLADESKAIAEAMRTYGSTAAPPVVVQASTVPLPLPPLKDVKPVAQYEQMPVTETNKIYVQAGSFSSRKNASDLRNKLNDFGPVSVVEVVVKGTLFYRVRLGPIDTVPNADALLARVRKSGVGDARIVVAE